MAYTPKDWRDDPDHTTPLNAAALEDLETRVTDYTENYLTLARPTGTITESCSRVNGPVTSPGASLNSGALCLVGGGLVIPAGVTPSSITFTSGGTPATTPTNQWFCLVRRSDLVIVAVTADDGTTAWGGNTRKTLNLSAWTPSVLTPVYAGVLVVAATVPSLHGLNLNSMASTLRSLAPVLAGQSSSGLTSPLPVGTVVASPTNQAVFPYCYVS